MSSRRERVEETSRASRGPGVFRVALGLFAPGCSSRNRPADWMSPGASRFLKRSGLRHGHRALLVMLAFAILLSPFSLAAKEKRAAPREVRHQGILVRVEGGEDAEWEAMEELIGDQLTLSSDSTPSEPLADDLAFFTRSHLVQSGWPGAAVAWKIEGEVIRLMIASGERVKVGDIRWEGNTALERDELRMFLLRPVQQRTKLKKDDELPWVEGDLERGAALVRRRLRADGFLRAEVELLPAGEAILENRRGVTVRIVQGPAFKFGRVAVAGAPPELQETLQSEATGFDGGPFNEARVQALTKTLEDVCRDGGYLKCAVAANYLLHDSGGASDVRCRVTPGERARVARIVPDETLSRGAKRVLHGAFRSVEGRPYLAEDLDIVFRRVLDTGMFQRLDFETADAGGDDVDLVLRGEETQPHAVGFSLGYDTFRGPEAGVSYRNTNFFDRGMILNSELTWSTSGPLGYARVTDPAVFGTGFALGAGLSFEHFERYDYARNTGGLSLDLTRRVSVPFSFTVSAGQTINGVTSDLLTAEELGAGSYGTTSLGASLLLDHRDSQTLPTRGWMLAAKVESIAVTGDSPAALLRNELSAAYYHPITKKLRFAAGAQFRQIQGAAAEEMPVDLRVFNGGATSVRSFAENELGPMSALGETPLGGTSAFSASAELSVEIAKNLELAAFADTGSLVRAESGQFFDFSTDFRHALGVGLRYRLPFGPFRVDYGFNPDRRAGEKSGALHVTLGFAF